MTEYVGLLSLAAALVTLVLLWRFHSGVLGELRSQREENERRALSQQNDSERRAQRTEEAVQGGLRWVSEAHKGDLEALARETGRLLEAYRQTMQDSGENIDRRVEQLRLSQEDRLTRLGGALDEQLERTSGDLDRRLTAMQRATDQRLAEMGEGLEKGLTALQESLEKRQAALQEGVEKRLTELREGTEKRLASLQQTNEQKLEEMRATVDEKLHKALEERISQSFALVSKRLEEVYKGLGEMQNLAAGVGDLKKVLSNVKTRGILGEIQLGAILEQIMAPEQYQANVVTKKGSREVVEFAIRLPGADGDTVWLPIDAKFPADAYQQLLEAYDGADPQAAADRGAALERRIKSFAKDIRDKYLNPPVTTEFAIMFLPVEGLYAEVVRRGLVETLQRDYKVNIAGPTTLAALLNSLQMGFRTLAIQKRSGEVWQVLGAVKTEFDKFAKVLSDTRQRLDQAGEALDRLVGVRTRQIQRQLKSVSTLAEDESRRLLEQAEETDGENEK